MLILKINFKNKKNIFNIFLNKKYFKKQHQQYPQTVKATRKKNHTHGESYSTCIIILVICKINLFSTVSFS